MHPRNQKHRGLMRVINNAAKVAGLQTRYEPDTHSLLLGEFSKADCRRVFPKSMSKAYKAGFEKVSQAADFIASANCTLSPVEKQNFIHGLLVDLCIENPNTGETKWVDTTVVHTTSASYENKELKAIAKKNLSASVASSHGVTPFSLLQALLCSIVKRSKLKNTLGL